MVMTFKGVSSDSPALRREPPSVRVTVAQYQSYGHNIQERLKKEPRFEKEPPSILLRTLRLLATLSEEVPGESPILKRSSLPPV